MAFTPFVETDQPTMANFNEKFQECIQSALDLGVQIETGSYVGTGSNGANSPNSLTFGFVPDFVIISSFGWEMDSGAGFFTPKTLTQSFTSYAYAYCNRNGTAALGEYNAKIVGNVLSWHNLSSNEYWSQLNTQGLTYYYYAVRKEETSA